MQYSERFKAEMIQKMTGPGAMSANRLSKEVGVGQPILSRWLKQAKVRGMKMPTKVGERKRWTPEEKLRVLLDTATAGESGRGEILRREGLHEADIKRFQEELVTSAKGTTTPKRDAGDKRRILELEREVRRKDRALAEAVALAVLSKKLNAYFEGDEVGDTNKDSEK